MKTYRLQLHLPGGTITPWLADTIFGHLCWVAERHGGFRTFSGADGLIELYRSGQPPMILSDGFPGDYLPAPADLRTVFEQGLSASPSAAEYALLKQVKGIKYLTQDQFAAYRNGDSFPLPTTPEAPVRRTVTLHNQISRLTNTTGGDGGGLYEQEEVYLGSDVKGRLSIYCRLADGFEEDARTLFERLAVGGYGKKRTSGKGAFSLADFEPFLAFDAPLKEPAGVVMLSHFVPAPTDPTDGAYTIRVKYGKLGEEKTFCGNPFKKPLIMLQPGAVFRTQRVSPWYGRLVEGITYEETGVVQYGFGLALPVARVGVPPGPGG